MRDVDLCRAIGLSLGTDTYLAVAKLAMTTTSIPTTSLAAKRFEIGVLASTPDWFGAGLLSDVHVATLLRTVPDNLSSLVKTGLARFDFRDPYSNLGDIKLHATMVVVGLAGFATALDAFRAIATQLQDAGQEFPEDRKFVDRPELWCVDDD